MRSRRVRGSTWLVAIVLVHLVISVVHGSAHTGAQVALSPAQNLFVFIVILAGPLVGAVLLWPAARLGSWVIMVTMGASVVFGAVNHFVLASPDHVAHVSAEWRPLFATTAVLLAVTEAVAVGVALGAVRERNVS